MREFVIQESAHDEHAESVSVEILGLARFCMPPFSSMVLAELKKYLAHERDQRCETSYQLFRDKIGAIIFASTMARLAPPMVDEIARRAQAFVATVTDANAFPDLELDFCHEITRLSMANCQPPAPDAFPLSEPGDDAGLSAWASSLLSS